MDASSSFWDDDDWEIVSTSSQPRSPSPKGDTSGSEAAPGAAEAIGTTVQALVPAQTSVPRLLVSHNMPGWKEDYLSSILEAEKNNPVNQELVEACEFALGSQSPPHLPLNAQQEEGLYRN